MSQVLGVDQRAANVVRAVAGKRAEKRIERAEGLPPRGDAAMADELEQLGARVVELYGIVRQKDDGRRVVAIGDGALVRLRERLVGVARHGERVAIDEAVALGGRG